MKEIGKKSGKNREDLSAGSNIPLLNGSPGLFKRSGFWVFPGIILGVGMGISVAIALLVSRWELASYRLQFQRRTDNLATTLQRSINRYTDVLYALGDFYRVEELDVSSEEFNIFVRRSILTYPGIQALEWAPVVSAAERDAFESAMQSTLSPTFIITERDVNGTIIPARERSHYVPVTYLQPRSGNEPALGFDLASDDTRRSALETARDTGAMTASARIQLVQEQADQFGFLVFLPVYDSPLYNTLQLRRQRVFGYILGVFRVADVVENSLRGLSLDVDFYLYDQAAEPGDRFLGFYDAQTQRLTVTPAEIPDAPTGRSPRCSRPTNCVYTLDVAGRQWAMQFRPASTYPSPVPLGAIATLTIGILLSGLLALYLTRSQTELQRTKELSDLKLRLFSMASHEFRTPLSTILISAQSLEAHSNSTLSPEQTATMYTRIRSSAKRMNQLLSDLLTLTRAEAGKLDFSPELLNLRQLCLRLMDDIQGSVDSPRDIQFTHQGDCEKVFADPKLVQSILANLLSNAVKYSPHDQPIDVHLACTQQTITIQIRDRGIGIPKSDQARLYEAFYRGQNVGAIAGTGLGLAVVQTCLQLHQGRIHVESREGIGTQFTVTLPNQE